MSINCGLSQLISECPTAATNSWTLWLDRDNPSATGDYENVVNYYPNGGTPCTDGNIPTAIQCRVHGTQESWDLLPYADKLICDVASGFQCINSELPHICPDFEVRFYCGANAPPTSVNSPPPPPDPLTDCADNNCEDCIAKWPPCVWSFTTNGCMSTIDHHDELPVMPVSFNDLEFMVSTSKTQPGCDERDMCSEADGICMTDLGPDWSITPWETLQNLAPQDKETLLHTLHLDLYGTIQDIWKNSIMHVSWKGKCCYGGMEGSRTWFVRTDENGDRPNFFQYLIDSMYGINPSHEIASLGRYKGQYNVLCSRPKITLAGWDDSMFCNNNNVAIKGCSCTLDSPPPPSPPPPSPSPPPPSPSPPSPSPPPPSPPQPSPSPPPPSPPRPSPSPPPPSPPPPSPPPSEPPSPPPSSPPPGPPSPPPSSPPPGPPSPPPSSPPPGPPSPPPSSPPPGPPSPPPSSPPPGPPSPPPSSPPPGPPSPPPSSPPPGPPGSPPSSPPSPLFILSPDPNGSSSINGTGDPTLYLPPTTEFTLFPPPPHDSIVCSGWATRDLPLCPWWFLPLIIVGVLTIPICICLRYYMNYRRRRENDEELCLLDSETSVRRSLATDFSMNMMNTQPSSRVSRVSTITNPLALLSTPCPEELDATGWCQCVDSESNDFFIHTKTGAISYEMPDEQVRHRLSLQHDCMVKLTNILSQLDIEESSEELKGIRVQIMTDLAIIENACAVVSQSVGSATETSDALARAETNLVRLEELAVTRSTGSLWGVARDAMGQGVPPVSNAWSTLLDNIHRVRDNLRPIHAASKVEIDEVEEQNAWIRSAPWKVETD